MKIIFYKLLTRQKSSIKETYFQSNRSTNVHTFPESYDNNSIPLIATLETHGARHVLKFLQGVPRTEIRLSPDSNVRSQLGIGNVENRIRESRDGRRTFGQMVQKRQQRSSTYEYLAANIVHPEEFQQQSD